MELNFIKMQGCGNDYIYFDCMEKQIPLIQALATQLSDRHFGVGGDGIVLMEKSRIADAKMRMFNADGSEGKMCGNAIRCVAKYLYDYGYVNKRTLLIETRSGLKRVDLVFEGEEVVAARVHMGAAEFSAEKIPVDIQMPEVVNYPIKIQGNIYRITCVNLGNPHCVIFCEDPDEIPLETLGPAFEKHPVFPQQVNTEFVQVVDPQRLKMRVWERGSGETLACGTGASAAVVAAVRNGICRKDEKITVRLRGGDLWVEVKSDGVFMTGNAAYVFKGSVHVLKEELDGD